ncbi:MAG: hypothetical protein ABR589_09660, partial [Chthoniobacterales bacterium]
ELSGAFKSFRGAQTAPLPTPAPPLPAGSPSAADAARLLSQSTFGPTEELIAHVQEVGVEAFLQEQMRIPATSHVKFVETLGGAPAKIQAVDAWWSCAIAARRVCAQRNFCRLGEDGCV